MSYLPPEQQALRILSESHPDKLQSRRILDAESESESQQQQLQRLNFTSVIGQVGLGLFYGTKYYVDRFSIAVGEVVGNESDGNSIKSWDSEEQFQEDHDFGNQTQSQNIYQQQISTQQQYQQQNGPSDKISRQSLGPQTQSQSDSNDLSFLSQTSRQIAASSTSAAIMAILLQPIDIIRVRLHLQHQLEAAVSGPIGSNKKSSGSKQSTTAYKDERYYRGCFTGMRRIVLEEGIFGLIKPGLSAAVMREVVSGGLRLGLYPTIFQILDKTFIEPERRAYGKNYEGTSEATEFSLKFVSAMTSGVLAALLSNPLDLVKIRFQAEGWQGGGYRNGGIVNKIAQMGVIDYGRVIEGYYGSGSGSGNPKSNWQYQQNPQQSNSQTLPLQQQTQTQTICHAPNLGTRVQLKKIENLLAESSYLFKEKKYEAMKHSDINYIAERRDLQKKVEYANYHYRKMMHTRENPLKPQKAAGAPPGYIKTQPKMPEYQPPRTLGGNRYHGMQFYSTLSQSSLSMSQPRYFNYASYPRLNALNRNQLKVNQIPETVTDPNSTRASQVHVFKVEEREGLKHSLKSVNTTRQMGFMNGLFVPSNPGDFQKVEIPQYVNPKLQQQLQGQHSLNQVNINPNLNQMNQYQTLQNQTNTNSILKPFKKLIGWPEGELISTEERSKVGKLEIRVETLRKTRYDQSLGKSNTVVATVGDRIESFEFTRNRTNFEREQHYITGLYRGSKPKYRSTLEALIGLYHDRQWLRGAGPQCLRSGMVTAVQISTYEYAKKRLIQKYEINPDYQKNRLFILSAMFSAGVTALITAPVDLIKSRVMSDRYQMRYFWQHPTHEGFMFTNGMDCFRRSVGADGGLSMWRGVTASFFRFWPQMVVGWPLLEKMREVYGLPQ